MNTEISTRHMYGKARETKKVSLEEFFDLTHLPKVEGSSDNKFFIEYFMDPLAMCKFYLDIDRYITEKETISSAQQYTLNCLRMLMTELETRRMVTINFSGARPDGKKKMSMHVIFPDLIIRREILVKCSHQILGRYGIEAGGSHMIPGLDKGVYKTNGSLRQWGLQKPKKGQSQHIVGPGGEFTLYELTANDDLREVYTDSGDRAAMGKEFTLKMFGLSLPSYIPSLDGVIDLSPKFEGTLALVNDPSIARDKLSSNFRSNGAWVDINPNSSVLPREIIDKITELYNAIEQQLAAAIKDAPDDSIMLPRKERPSIPRLIRTARILWGLPSIYGYHEERQHLIPVIKAFEEEIGFDEGEFFMAWFLHIRKDPGIRDYLRNYQGFKFDPEKAPDPHYVADGFKINFPDIPVTYEETSIVLGQKDFLDINAPLKYKNFSELSKVVASMGENGGIPVRSSKRWNLFLRDVFSSICMVTHKTTKQDMLIYKELDLSGINVYTMVEIPQRGKSALVKSTFKTEVKDKYTSFLQLMNRSTSLFRRSYSYDGPWSINSNSLNLSPRALIQPKKNGNYSKFVEDFKSYFTQTFLGYEKKKNHERFFNYLMAWYRNMIFNQHKNKVMLVLSDENGGIGKTLLFNNIVSMILGDYYVYITKERLATLTEKFNDYRDGQKLTVFEEGGSHDTLTQREISSLKEMLTSRILKSKVKYRPDQEFVDVSSYVLLTNNKVPLLINKTDRRIVFLKIKNPFGDQLETVAQDFATMVIDNLPNFVYFLKNDVVSWKEGKYEENRIITSAMSEQEKISTSIKRPRIYDDLESGFNSINPDLTGEARDVTMIRPVNGQFILSYPELVGWLNGRPDEPGFSGWWTTSRARTSAMRDTEFKIHSRSSVTTSLNRKGRFAYVSMPFELFESIIEIPDGNLDPQYRIEKRFSE